MGTAVGGEPQGSRFTRHAKLPQDFCQTDTCVVLSAVNAERSQPAQRYFRFNPAIRAMRSISAGQVSGSA